MQTNTTHPADLLDRLPADAVSSFAEAARVLRPGGPLALKPVRASRHTPGPDLGGGADAARAASQESHPSPKTSEEVSR